MVFLVKPMAHFSVISLYSSQGSFVVSRISLFSHSYKDDWMLREAKVIGIIHLHICMLYNTLVFSGRSSLLRKCYDHHDYWSQPSS